MSAIKFIRGDDLGFLVSFADNDEIIDISDGTWNVQASLRYQTERGPSPFDLAIDLSSSGATISITSDQTSQLRTDGTGYILLIRASKVDGTVTLTTPVVVKVEDDLF